MCRPTPRLASRSPRDLETRQIQALGEALGGSLRHWGRAALELRRARKGSARIPLRGESGQSQYRQGSREGVPGARQCSYTPVFTLDQRKDK
ncbi:hypothetical protein NDU88_003495 [Pleurodeles waltl]|uniref:Uncharacterized protein n=1 Tax=Pleurodeles waltl TaxID=8319 RepID=A0AAV7W5T2_PLEWA|nr:hypothetical protein NDU88_003495 [Pleurodeles waltl]